jgi:hypothetical protein
MYGQQHVTLYTCSSILALILWNKGSAKSKVYSLMCCWLYLSSHAWRRTAAWPATETKVWISMAHATQSSTAASPLVACRSLGFRAACLRGQSVRVSSHRDATRRDAALILRYAARRRKKLRGALARRAPPLTAIRRAAPRGVSRCSAVQRNVSELSQWNVYLFV